MKIYRILVYFGLGVVLVALISCGSSQETPKLSPAPPGFENFKPPEERLNEKGGFQKVIPKSPKTPKTP